MVGPYVQTAISVACSARGSARYRCRFCFAVFFCRKRKLPITNTNCNININCFTTKEKQNLHYLTLEFPTGGGVGDDSPSIFGQNLSANKSKNLLFLGSPRGFNYAHFEGSIIHGVIIHRS